MTTNIRRFRAFAISAAVLIAGVRAFGQTEPGLRLPPGAVALEGTPQVKIETTRDGAVRRELDPASASTHTLRIRIDNGRLYWPGLEQAPVAVSSAGGFTYLTREPGKYVRIRRVNDRLTYVEHVDTVRGGITYWGELRVVLGK